MRQLVWIAPLLALPAVAWIRRRERKVAIAAGLLWSGSLAAVVLCLRWFLSQPFADRRAFSYGPIGRILEYFHLWKYSVEDLLSGGVACLLLALPILLLYLADIRRRFHAPGALAAGLALPGLAVWALIFRLKMGFLLGDILTEYGILEQGGEALGLRPEVLPAPLRGLLAVLVVMSAGVLAAGLLEDARRRAPSAKGDTAADGSAGSLRIFVWVLVPSCVVYAVAILYRGVLNDRYLLPLLPALAVPLLWRCQRMVRRRPPVLGWVALGIFACYGIAITHDFLAAGRARLQAVTALTRAGVPRTRISAGLEFDNWTELERFGRFHLSRDPDFPKADRPKHLQGPDWEWEAVPGIDPAYFVTYSTLHGLQDAGFPHVWYRSWLPPFRQQVFTLAVPVGFGK